MVQDLYRKMGIVYEDGPRDLPSHVWDFRHRFLKEEIIEYEDADSREEEFDALLDLIYVALGTLYLYGFDFYEGFKRVHEANMMKDVVKGETLDGSGKHLSKPEGWVPPNLKDLVK